MAASRSRKLRQASSADFDFLSNLPNLIKVKILALLPLKEAVRTSTLSKRWTHTWFGIPSLVIYEDEIGFRTLAEFIALVYRLLSGHAHFMAKLKLVFLERYEWFGIKDDLDKWINTFSKKHGHELVLDFGYAITVKIPARIFSLCDLEILHLRGCELNVPKYFDGFKWVHTMKLENIKLTGVGIERLVLSCPLLRYFFIHTEYLENDDLDIRSPSLLELDIIADFEDLHLETPKLVTLFASVNKGHICVDSIVGYECRSKYENNISRLMCCLPQVQNLDINWKFVKCLDSGVIPVQLPVSLNLTKMAIELHNGAPKCFDVLLCLLRSAPKLCDLHVKFDGDDYFYSPYREDFWEDAEATSCQLNRLQTVIVGCEYFDLNCFVPFVKFILKSAPVLEMVGIEEKMHIELMPGGTKLLMELHELPRLSNNAIIKVI